MKQLLLIIAVGMGIFSGLAAQNAGNECQDVVYLKNGSIFRGKIQSYAIDSALVMTTWSGVQLNINSGIVKKIVQHCKGMEGDRLQFGAPFKDKKWYNLTRFSAMPGGNQLGLGIQNSTGYRFSRWCNVGVGLGLETFDMRNDYASVLPVFAEGRTYFLSGAFSPFAAIGLGYGYHTQPNLDQNFISDGVNEDWKGGWMAQGQLGLRAGRHFMLHLGIRFQHKVRIWTNPWSSTTGTDNILFKRLDFGLGILL